MKLACIRQCIWSIFFVIALALPIQAQDERGWGFSGRFQGSSNSSGVVLKVAPALEYTFNEHFRTYAGLPIYFVNPSSTSLTTTSTTKGFTEGIGNAYLGFRVGSRNPALNFASNLVLTAPTGDTDKGFSTGRATADWTNSFNRRFSSVTPFGSVGLANTVSDTSFFVRPFSSLGLVTHFEGGSSFDLARVVEVGASAYGVRGAGQQRIFSKLVKRAPAPPPVPAKGKTQPFQTTSETVGSADLANDHGFSGWLGVNPRRDMDLQVGYTRSVDYSLDTLFFGVGFHLGK